MASSHARETVKIKHKIWLERDGVVLFGQGRSVLLRAIEECGSLNSAAKKLNMSYRAAWGRLKASEERLGIKLVQMDAAGGGMRLTKHAKQLLDKFDRFETETEKFLKTISRELHLLAKT
jgi:molybdate transport system regulatory protein